MEHIAWDSPAELIIGRDQTLCSGTLARCVLHFRDQLSITRQVVSRIALTSSSINGKTWLFAEDIPELTMAETLPPEPHPAQ